MKGRGKNAQHFETQAVKQIRMQIHKKFDILVLHFSIEPALFLLHCFVSLFKESNKQQITNGRRYPTSNVFLGSNTWFLLRLLICQICLTKFSHYAILSFDFPLPNLPELQMWRTGRWHFTNDFSKKLTKMDTVILKQVPRRAMCRKHTSARTRAHTDRQTHTPLPSFS